jgi:hypothetical protein
MPSPKRNSPKRNSPKRHAPATLRPVSTNRAVKIVLGLAPANRSQKRNAFASLPPSLRTSLMRYSPH